VTTTTPQTLTLTARVASPDAATNTATITHADQFDQNPGNNTAAATATPQQADLQVTKSVSDPTPNVGDTITYTITLRNAGPDAATNVTLEDSLPADVTFVSAAPSQGSYNSATGVWTVGTVSPGIPLTLILTATVTSPGATANTATVSHSDQFDQNPGNNTATTSIVPQQADLAVLKSVDQPRPNVGGIVTFTVTLSNSGPNTATDVVISDPLPSGLQFVGATASQGAYDNATGLWTVGTVAPSTPQTLLIEARVVSPDAQTNVAAVFHDDQFDPDPANNTGIATVTPQRADLAVTKTVSDVTPNVGDTVTFTVTLANLGPDAATGVTVHDLLPAGVTFVSAAPAGSYNPATGVWTVGTVNPSAAQTLTLTARVVSPGAATNTATITAADQFDPDTTNNTASATATPQQADLAIAKTVSNTTPNVGDVITYTVTLTNNGPDAATGVTVSEPLPAGLSFVSASPGLGSYNSATGMWTVGTVAGGATVVLTLNARVVSPAAQTDTATVSHSDQFDQNPGNNTASVTETPQQADLAVAKAVSDPTPNVGDVITFTITVSNSGPDAATGVQVSDVLPAGLQFVSATPSQGAYNGATGVWAVGTVAAGIPQTLAIRARVVSPAAQTNSATVSHSDQFDQNPGNNTGSATETPQQADLALAKAVDNATPNVGDTVTFTVTLTNNGPDAATDVTVTDLLPTGLVLVTATPSQGTYNDISGVWTVGTVTTTTPQTLTLTARVASPDAATNTATITHADQFDQNPGNNTGSATTTPQQADLALAKVVSNATPHVGDTITFDVTLTNNGPDPATGVTVTDPLPAGLTFVAAVPSQGTYDSTTGVWTVGGVTPGTPQTLRLQARVDGPTAQTNTATITAADQFDPDTANNQASVTEAPLQADLAVTKRVSAAQVFFGSTAVFTVVVHNNGPDPATGVSVLDPLPAGLTFVQAVPSQGTYSAATGTWAIGILADGASATLQLVVRVNVVGTVVNAAGVRADEFDPDLTNDRATAAVTGLATPALISKRSLLASASVPPPTDFALALGMRLTRPLSPDAIAVGTEAGGSEVRVMDPGNVVADFSAFNSYFRGGVRVAVGDVNGDGVPDVVAAAGPGGGPNVRVFDGRTGLPLAGPLGNFLAYDRAFAGGVYVAVADVNGDGFADIVTGAGPGGGPHVKVFSGRDGSVLASFLAYARNFTGGVRVAAGDVNGDGFADIVTGAGPGGGPHVKAFDGRNPANVLASFFAYPSGFTGGVYVAAGDTNGDGRADIVTGPGAGVPQVRVFDGTNVGRMMASFLPYGANGRGGATVATADRNGDGRADILTGAGPGGAPRVEAFDGTNPAHLLESFLAFDPGFLGGVFVG
jgi:uncharacterized repeat protein (TIGR01451 family)